jgi:hypothetical protein
VSGLRGRERREMKKGKEKTNCFCVFELQKERRCLWEFVLAHGGFERSCERCLFLLLLLLESWCFLGAGPGFFRWLLIGKAYHQCLYDDG